MGNIRVRPKRGPLSKKGKGTAKRVNSSYLSDLKRQSALEEHLSNQPLDPVQRELLDRVNQSMEKDTSRRWLIRIVFALTAVKDPKGRPRKGAGMFIFRPGAVMSKDHEVVVGVRDRREAEEALDESKLLSQTLMAKDLFLVDEKGGPSGITRISLSSLITRAMKVWRSHPINTIGDIDMYYERAWIKLPREVLLQSSSREEILTNASEIIRRMDKQLMFDSWTQGHRAKGDGGFGPWVERR